jgi:hypothetical protein
MQTRNHDYYRDGILITTADDAHIVNLLENDCYSVMAPEKSWWRVVDVGAVSPCAW